MTLLDVAPTLRALMRTLSSETCEEIRAELLAIESLGRAQGFERAARAIKESNRRTIASIGREFDVRAKVNRGALDRTTRKEDR